jgi:imidazolonepropionase
MKNKSTKADLAVIHASQLATPEGNQALSGGDTGHLRSIDDAAVASRNGKIVFVGSTEAFHREVTLADGAEVIEARDQTVIPGFVDCHTHLPFSGDRAEEFLMRVSGSTYEEIARAGGGIKTTVSKTRQASREELVKLSLERLDSMLLHGTTTCEAKSGYGLAPEEEVRQLEAIQQASGHHPIDVCPTFLGAHTVPEEFSGKRGEYVSLIIDKMLPEVSRRKLAEFCDVFCDEHGFTIEESKSILLKAKEYHLQLKVHADQFSSYGAARLAAELEAVSADHLERLSEDDILFLSKHKIVGVLLPGSVYFLKKEQYAPAREMLQAGMALALSTDFNPGSSMTESMIQIIQLAVFMMDVTVDEAITMATLNGAAALSRADRAGSIEVGKEADLIILNIPNRIHLAYHFGINHCSSVIKKGKICVRDGRIEY